MTAEDTRHVVGVWNGCLCTYHGPFRGVCSCGFSGPIRRRKWRATRDANKHMLHAE